MTHSTPREETVRQSEKRVPLQVKLSQTGRWEREANGSQRQEGESMFFESKTNWCRRWEAESSLTEGHLVAMVALSTVASKIAIKTKLVSGLRHPEFHQLTQIKPTHSSWHEFPPKSLHGPHSHAVALFLRVNRTELRGRFVLVLEWKLKCLFQLGCNQHVYSS